ncbi:MULTISPECIES: trypsin-like peptidase domain-containing protein [unclassified Streptomyces]|uniref:VMAP-C domain-containing protein n=1 Tax=unclassified Streptomyces TaxID=2593676 RepID=UPI002E30F0DC|nr:trypsin-like peptidase domain-containing protein [Streptomyces sp. NBC_01268]
MNAFDALVRPALVRIAAPGGGYDPHGDPYWGTGFFIAPGWVLTCAHVVAKGGSAVWRDEPAVGITWEGGETTGRVVLAKPRPATPEEVPARWDFPDLALVHVPDAQGAACVRLSERPPTTPSPISLHGWSHQTGEVRIRHAEGEAHAVDGGALLLRWTLPVEGVSGGPVVDLRRGAVIGLNKGRGRDEGAAVPLTALRELHDVPGGEILHEVLRAHDRHHLARLRSPRGGRTWTAAQMELWPATARGVSPVRRAQLYGRFAELPPPTGPGEVMALVDAVKRRVLHPDYQAVLETDARTWRDGVGLLHELHATQQENRPGSTDLGLDAVLLYAAHIVRHLTDRYGSGPGTEGLGRLEDWIVDESGGAHGAVQEEIAALLDPEAPRTGAADAEHEEPAERPAREAGARADVRIEVDPVPWATPQRYTWRLMLLFDGRTVSPLSGNDTGVARDQLQETLRAPLVDALRRGDSGDHLAAVEVVLPRELFDLPLDTWRLTPEEEHFGERSLPLGQRRIVVLRDRHRSHHPPSPEWRRRWRGSESGPLRAVPLRAEVLAAGAEGHAPHVRRESRMGAYERLGGAVDGSVPVYCGPVGGGDGHRAMDVALAAGHPIALWRHGAPEHGDCAEFHHKAGKLLAGAGSAEGLHQPVRTLRMRAADVEADPSERSEHAWAEDLAVLYDPPDRPPFDDLLQGPPLLGEADR